uniref:Uncharacterized protein n=1 Tax=Anguilla anguilla TaxID=7936 RepID=A0A0E9SV54_ANGAN
MEVAVGANQSKSLTLTVSLFTPIQLPG